jgi:Ca2+-binding EF-hand superfamily protein
MKHGIPAFSLVLALATAVSAQEAMTYNDSHLTALDADGNASISKSEFEGFANFAFKEMDDDKNGSLSPDEVDDHVVGDAFSILDDNGDGSVSREEFLTQMSEDFEAADKDGDGQLN